MTGHASTVPPRDAMESVFCRILSALEAQCPGFKAAVFFDGEGETIDYHSFLDPFETRLLAAHVGVLLSSADARSRWLGMGGLREMEIFGANMDLLVIPIADGFSVVLVVDAGAEDARRVERLQAVAIELRNEAGL